MVSLPNTESSSNTNAGASPPSLDEMIAAVRWARGHVLAGDEFAAPLDAAQAHLEASRWRPRTEITIDLTGQEDEAQRVYDAVEKLLHDMGEIGTLSMYASPPATNGREPHLEASRPANKITEGLRGAIHATSLASKIIDLLPPDTTRDMYLLHKIIAVLAPYISPPATSEREEG